MYQSHRSMRTGRERVENHEDYCVEVMEQGMKLSWNWVWKRIAADMEDFTISREFVPVATGHYDHDMEIGPFVTLSPWDESTLSF